jgi:NhaP-type Na+/H+ or K+/H+ antiporter
VNGIGLLLVVIGAVAAAVARRWRLPAALVVVALASAVSFLPGLPRLELAPESILAVVLPPLLYSATLDTSFVSFRRDLWPIAALGVGLVVFSAFTVGLFASWVVPGLTLGGAFILGAVLAPSDAVAASAFGRKLRLPSRLMTIMTGESLVNDAVALIIFQVAVAAVADTKSFIGQPVLMLLYSATLGVGVGLLTARAVHWIRPRLHDPARKRSSVSS